MPFSEIRVRVEPPSQRRIATARWDRDSATFCCTIASVDRPRAAPSLRARIDASLRVEAHTRRAVLGDVDVLLDEADRPSSIEVYTNPTQWQRREAEGLGAVEAADVVMEASWDPNGIASVNGSVTIEHDAARTALTLRFGDDAPRWVAYADGMYIGIGADKVLLAMRFEPVTIEI